MAQKRLATSDLNRDNWEEEDVPEEMGIYKMASSNELKMRSMKRAKRRGVAGNGDGDGGSVFKNFKGFGTANSESTTPTFSFLSNDMDKPKLVCPSNSFPSFSFNKNSDSSKMIDEDKSSKIESLEKPNMPSFTISSQNLGGDINSNDTSKKSDSKSTFKFGINEDTASNKSEKSMLSSFNFNPSKSDNDLKKSEHTEFKFGVDFKESKFANSSKLFEFGIQSSNNAEQISDSPSLSGSKSQDNGIGEKNVVKVNGVKSNLDCESKKNNLFLANLKALNLGVLKWVQEHVDKNQYINLSPIFDDYKVHFQEIKKKFDNASLETKYTDENKLAPKLLTDKVAHTLPVSKDNSSPSSSASLFSFGSSNAKDSKEDSFVFGMKQTSELQTTNTNSKTSENSKINQTKFNFGMNASPNLSKGDFTDSSNKSTCTLLSFGKDNPPSSLLFNATDSKTTFNFGSSESKNLTSEFNFSSKDSKVSGFSFKKSDDPTPSTEFTFSTTNSPVVNADKDVKEEQKDEPSDSIPEENVIEVKEDDAVYEEKVKLFYKKGDQYATMGLGTLFLKPVGEKTQLIVRTKTNLGQILLNIFLYESTPTQRVGKNNVMLVCIPNPPIDTKSEDSPVSILIRVKTESDADELLQQINKNKK